MRGSFILGSRFVLLMYGPGVAVVRYGGLRHTSWSADGERSVKYSIVYSTVTGNTRQLAEVVEKTLTNHTCVYTGRPDEAALDAPVLVFGFWTWRSTCSKDLQAFLKTVRDKRVFIFGSAGASPAKTDYYERVIGAVCDLVHESNEIAGTFMCQGRMPESVKRKYEEGRDHHPTRTREEKLANYEAALSHPDEDDLRNLEAAVRNAFELED